MSREIWIMRHGHRRDYEPGWENHPRYKENKFDPPLSKYGFELAEKGVLELIKKSKALKNKEIKFIYCSPFTRCIQSAIQIIDIVKKELEYDIKLIIVYKLGENSGYPIYEDFEFNGDKLNINRVFIDKKMKPSYLRMKYKKYISKIIGSDIKDVTYDNELKNMAKEIININNKEKESYIIMGHQDTIRIAYKFFNQNKITKKVPKWANGGPENVNTMMAFLEKDKGYKMIYKPNNKF